MVSSVDGTNTKVTRMTPSASATAFYADNTAGTFADALTAVGLAETLYTWLNQLSRDASPITIRDRGGYFLVTIPSLLDMHAVAQVTDPFLPGRGQALVSRRTGTDLEPDLPRYDYDAARRRRNDYFAQLTKLTATDRARYHKNPHADEFAALSALRPDTDLDLYIYINHFRAADAYNKLLRQWRGQNIEAFRANLALLLTIFAQYPNALVAGRQYWQELVKSGVAAPIAAKGDGGVTLLQVLNPASGKGGNALKANALGIGNLSGFWLPEFLKFVGLFTIAAPRLVKGAKDRKTYVLHPATIDRESLHDVMRRFRAGMLSPTTSIALDILAVLRFTRAFVEYRRDALIALDPTRCDPLQTLIGARPCVTDFAHGFDVAFFKDMGSAYATLHQATINLPAWAPPIISPEHADTLLDLLTEHERVIASIKATKGGEGSDEIGLLRRYRDFLSGRDPARFFDFAAHYGGDYLSKRHHNVNAGQFTVAGIEYLEALMTQLTKQKPFHPITQDPGFRALATAIRQATVTAQYRAAREPGYPFEIRYGLGQDLLRATAYPHDFMKALGTFVQAFNAENARIDERIARGSLHSHRRASVRTEHLDAITQLIDDYGGDAELIGTMLVAYGYARDAHTPGDPVLATSGGENLSTEGDGAE